jgi:hypothetical protein
LFAPRFPCLPNRFLIKNLLKISDLTPIFYSLRHIPNFDSTGLWRLNEIGFSKKGNLKETLLYLIEKSKSGKTHEELEKQLHIRVQNSLLDLINSNKINRTKISNAYLYTSANQAKSKKQIQNYEGHWQGYKEMGCPDWIIIEILASMIRVKSITIDSQKIVLELKLRKIIMTIEQVEKVISQFNLKKLWLRSDEYLQILFE